jgi:hypothetical protein
MPSALPCISTGNPAQAYVFISMHSIMRAVTLFLSSSSTSSIHVIAYSLTVTLVHVVKNVNLKEACAAGAADLPFKSVKGRAVVGELEYLH